VQVLEGCQAIGLLTDPSRDAVTGVRLRSRDGRADATGPAAEVAADLVVDASGRQSRALQWLAELGYQPPAETTISSLLGYASRQYAIPASFEADWRMLVINAKPPGNARSGAVVPIEGGRWMVALIGAGRDHPPTDDAGFLEFARGLRSPLLYDTIKDAEPASPIYGFRNTDNRRRHFERLRRWPDQFLVIGDASCTFNPIYAQGMTVTAMTAVALDRILAEHWRRSDTNPLGRARRAQRQVARTSAGAWTMATTEDLRYPWTEGARLDLPTRIMHRYADRVLEVANGNPKVNTAFVNVVNLRHPPASLLHPRVLLAVLAQHRAPPLTDPPDHPQGRCCTDLTDGPRPGPPSWQMERPPDPLNYCDGTTKIAKPARPDSLIRQASKSGLCRVKGARLTRAPMRHPSSHHNVAAQWRWRAEGTRCCVWPSEASSLAKLWQMGGCSPFLGPATAGGNPFDRRIVGAGSARTAGRRPGRRDQDSALAKSGQRSGGSDEYAMSTPLGCSSGADAPIPVGDLEPGPVGVPADSREDR